MAFCFFVQLHRTYQINLLFVPITTEMRKKIHFNLSLFTLLFALPFLFSSCGEKKQEKLFELMTGTGINFSNTIQNSKDFNIFSYRNFFNGGGVAVGDINNDGFADVFLTANMGSNKLYLNNGHFQFEDISEKAGITQADRWNTGVVMVDINNDGWLDIYVCNAGINKWREQQGNALFINNHDLTFTDKAKEYGLDNSGYTTHAAFFDYDLDGDLDCYILNNSFIPVNTLNYSNKRELRAKDWPVEDFLKGGGSFLMRNDSGHFTDVSEQAGIYGSLISFGLGITVGDVNGDQYPDIYVSNDFFERDYLYINQKNGTFKEDLENRVQHTSLASMGADMGDINNDGFPDIFTTDMLPDDDYRLKTTSSFDSYDQYRIKVERDFYYQYMQNTLQLNNRNGKFMDIAHFSGVAASDWSWGGLMFDADNDGYNDLYICNGINHDVTDQDFIDFFANDIIQRMVMTGEKEQVDSIINKMPSVPLKNKAFKNLGNLKFADVGESWGFTQPSFSNGAAYGDLDNDGDLDLIVNNVNGKAFVYKNNSREQQASNNYIGVLLKGKKANTFAIGSTVKIYQGNQVLTREIIPSRGFQSSIDYKTIIGLGNKQADSMVIIWPDRTFTTLPHPEINKVHVLQQDNPVNIYTEPEPPKSSVLLEEEKNQFDRHRENDYVDFYNERNIPEMMSREGPKAAYADVNGDGLKDLYIGGAAGQEGQLYLQTANGFIKKEEPVFKLFADYEDVACLFFDCDNDGDLDLFIGSGGNNLPPRSKQLQHRLYKNDGKGNFIASKDSFPNNNANISVAIANDFDNDGDMDLFVGGRSLPYNYGPSPPSYLLVNDGTGKFTDIALAKNPEIAQVGMVTAAAWVDITGDNKKELVITGEWMTPRIFSYQGDHFVEIKTNLDNMNGWWQSLAAADLDGDGDEDLVLGNAGENFYLKPDEQNPVKLWMNDFDMNGTVDKVCSRTVDGKDKPVFLKREFTEPLPSYKKENLRHEAYARKSIQELFKPELIKNARVKTFNYASSCIAWNEGNGKFTVQALPEYTQFSAVNSIVCTDINKDAKTDLVMAGNRFEFLPQFSRMDASFGHVLLNKGARVFEWINPAESGLQVSGEVRDIVGIQAARSEYLLFLQNNDYPVMYRISARKEAKKTK